MNEYYGDMPYSEDMHNSLMHSGVKGMRWGVRKERYQKMADKANSKSQAYYDAKEKISAKLGTSNGKTVVKSNNRINATNRRNSLDVNTMLLGSSSAHSSKVQNFGSRKIPGNEATGRVNVSENVDYEDEDEDEEENRKRKLKRLKDSKNLADKLVNRSGR